MKTRQLITLCTLLGSLIASGVSANDVPKPAPGNTSLSNTTVGGYVNSSEDLGSQARSHGVWWWEFLSWFRFH
jgi:hypothetical protein